MQAVTFYGKACEKGEMTGCRNLALQYQRGEGVPKDAEQALSLYHKACDGGDAGACEEAKSQD
jgi:TPR repeat protein